MLPGPPPPRAPRVSPLPVTIRRNVVAGSMTPWAEARLSAPRSWRLPAARAGGRPSYLPRGPGRSAALSPRPAQVPGKPRGEGRRGTPPGDPPPRRARRPAPAHRRHPQPPGSEPQGARFVSAPTRGLALLVLRLLGGVPGTWSTLRLCKLAPFPAAVHEAAETQMSGKLETSEHHRTAPVGSSLCGAREAAAEGDRGVGGWGENLTGKPSCDLLRLPPDGLVSKPLGSLPSQLFPRWPFVCLGGGGGGRWGNQDFPWTPPL